MDSVEIEFKKNLSIMKREASLKQCIWGEDDASDCKGRIIKAHSIQRSKILTKIADNGKVQFFSVHGGEDSPSTILDFEGIKKFSTFTGFCEKHDKEIFQPIEDLKFSATTEQKYIFAYRAAAKEYHANCELARSIDYLMEKKKRLKCYCQT